jgi:hypothetical protein
VPARRAVTWRRVGAAAASGAVAAAAINADLIAEETRSAVAAHRHQAPNLELAAPM